MSRAQFAKLCGVDARTVVRWETPDGPRPTGAAAAVLTFALALQLQLAVPILVLLMTLIALFRAGQQVASREPIDPRWSASGLAILAIAGLLGGLKFIPMLEILSSAKFRKLAEYPLHPDAWYVGFQQLWYGLWHHVPALPLLDRDGNPRVQEYITLMPGLSALLLAGVASAAVLFVIARGDCSSFRPHAARCPSFAAHLKDAKNAGVTLVARRIRWDVRDGVAHAFDDGAIPVDV